MIDLDQFSSAHVSDDAATWFALCSNSRSCWDTIAPQVQTTNRSLGSEKKSQGDGDAEGEHGQGLDRLSMWQMEVSDQQQYLDKWGVFSRFYDRKRGIGNHSIHLYTTMPLRATAAFNKHPCWLMISLRARIVILSLILY